MRLGDTRVARPYSAAPSAKPWRLANCRPTWQPPTRLGGGQRADPVARTITIHLATNRRWSRRPAPGQPRVPGAEPAV